MEANDPGVTPASIPRLRMLSLAARLKADRHQYVGGLKNIAYLVGYVRHVSKTGFLLQMNNSENLMIPIRFSPGGKLPRDFRDREPLKVFARLIGVREAEMRRTYLAAVRFERPNVLELPNAGAFRGAVHEQSSEDDKFRPYGSGNTPSAASNQAIVAGYVAGYSVREARVTEDGSQINGRLLIDVQQSGDPDRIIQVRLYGARYAAVAARLRMGMALLFYGRIRTDLIPTGRKDETSGKDIVMPYAYMQVEVPEIPTEADILFLDRLEQTPQWVRDMAEAAKARPRRSVVDGGASAPAVAAAAPPVSPSTADAPADAPATTGDYELT